MNTFLLASLILYRSRWAVVLFLLLDSMHDTIMLISFFYCILTKLLSWGFNLSHSNTVIENVDIVH